MLGLQPIDLAVLAGYFLVVIGIGVASARAVKGREDYLMGGRRFGKTLMMFFAFGAGTHADNAVGVAAQSYRYGLSGIWYQWVMLLTLPLTWLLAPVFRRARVLTTADFFERRFGTGFGVIYAAYGLFICVTFTSVMLYGSARLVESLTEGALSWQAILLWISAISFFYGIAGGLVAAVWNDFFQGILTVVMSVLILPFFWHRIGGLSGFQAAIPDRAEILDLVLSRDMTLFWIVMMAINSLVSMVAQPHIMATAAAGRSEMDSRIGFIGGLVLKRLVTIPWALTGVMAVAMYGAGTIEADHAFGAMAHDLLPAGFVGLMVACVLASVMDNAAVMMLSFAGLYSNNVHRKLWPTADEAKLLRINRVASLGFAAIAIPLSFAFSDVPAAMRFMWKTVPLIGIPFFLGLLWRRANRQGATASFLGAMAAMLVAENGLGWTGDAGLPKAIALFLGVGAVSGVVTSLLTPAERRVGLDRFYLLMNTPIGEESRLRAAGLREVPGTGTFELAPDGNHEAAAAAPAPAGRAWLEIPRPSAQSLGGACALLVLVGLMLGGVRLLAAWLRG